jgi:hypothetical protein
MKDLLTVYAVASCCITAVLFFGTYWDEYVREKHLITVPCSVNIVNMAKKINVTLMDECVIEN